MKRLFALTLSIFLLFLSACSNSSAPVTTPTIPPTATPSPTPQPTPTPIRYLKDQELISTFIDRYNSISDNDISDLTDMDIHGEDYKTEFRLNAFDNAIGTKGLINNGAVEVIASGAWSNSDFRLYATLDNMDTAIALYVDIIHVLDESISDEDIMSAIDGIDYIGDTSIVLGDGGYITGYIHTLLRNEGIELMIDCS